MKKHFEKIKSEGTCIHRLDEELIRRRREELRSVSHSLVFTVCFSHPAFPSQLNEPPACPHSWASCSSPSLFLFSSCTEVSKTGPGLHGGVNLGSLNSL